MSLFSAYEDFVRRTLDALKGNWEKLAFVAGLRGTSAEYEHWGLEHTYGPVAAKKAMAQAHSEVFQIVLETPIATLAEEIQSAPEKVGLERYVPANLDNSSKEHFRYVLTALSLLAKSRSNHRAA